MTPMPHRIVTSPFLMHTPITHTTQDRAPAQIILNNLTIPSQEGGVPFVSNSYANTPHSPVARSPPLPVLQLATNAYPAHPPPLEPAIVPANAIPQLPFPASLEHSLTPASSPKLATADPNHALLDNTNPEE